MGITTAITPPIASASPGIRQLFCHPVKGLTPAAIDRAELGTNWGMQGDRAFALMFTDLDRSPAPSLPWLPKRYFAVQNDWPDLARLQCRYDPEQRRLVVQRDGQCVLDANVERDRGAIGQWFTAFLQDCQPALGARHPQPAALELVGDTAGSTGFRDRRAGQISILGSATLEVLATRLDVLIDPRRFRPNLVLDTTEPWEEFRWVGQILEFGAVKLAITEPIERCLNIDVCPDSGQRDLPLLSTLKRQFRHTNTGVVAHVLQGGSLAIGDHYRVLAA